MWKRTMRTNTLHTMKNRHSSVKIAIIHLHIFSSVFDVLIKESIVLSSIALLGFIFIIISSHTIIIVLD